LTKLGAYRHEYGAPVFFGTQCSSVQLRQREWALR